jgi:hypothetical protein
MPHCDEFGLLGREKIVGEEDRGFVVGGVVEAQDVRVAGFEEGVADIE